MAAALVAQMPDGVRQVIAVDDHRGAASGVDWRVGDVTSPSVAEQLAGADVVVHLACPTDLESALDEDTVARRARALRSAQAVLSASAAIGARQVVAVTSAWSPGPCPTPRRRWTRPDRCVRLRTPAWSATCSRWSDWSSGPATAIRGCGWRPCVLPHWLARESTHW